MQQLQLFIADTRVDLFKDETINLTQTIQNVKDIGSIFTDFSRSFSVPASKNNNSIFRHYYNFQIINGFNANDKVEAEIKLNSYLFRKGYIALDGVNMKNNKPSAYKLTFFGETVDLKKKLKEITLQNVFEGDTTYTHDYNLTNVRQGLRGQLFSGQVIYPLISHTERFYYDSSQTQAGSRNLYYQAGTNQGVNFRDLKPALQVKEIISRIETFADLEFDKSSSYSFFNPSNTIFNQLYLWLARAKGNLGQSYTGEQEYNLIISEITPGVAQDWNPFDYTSGNLPSGVKDSFFELIGSNLYAGVWNVSPYADFQGGDFITITYTYRWRVIGTGASTFDMICEDVTGTPIIIKSQLGLTADGTTVHTIFGDDIGGLQNSSGVLTRLRWRVVTQDPTFTYTTELRLTKHFVDAGAGGGSETIDHHTITTVQPTGAISEIIISDQMPDMKVLDFLTSIFKMFNLTAYVQDDGKIQVQTLDSYYTEIGEERDISEFVDVEKSDINFAIPYQEIAFRFQPPKTFLAINFSQINNAVFGNLENSSNIGGIVPTDRGNKYVINVGFEKMLYERLNNNSNGSPTNIVFGWSVNKDQNPELTKPLLFIRRYTNVSSTRISMQNANSTGNNAGAINNYNRPANSLQDETINFGAEIDEFTGTVKTQSLFQENYFNYISGVFNTQRRLVKVKAFLPLKILLNYSLADTFIINGNEYIINSIQTNLQTGESDLELFNKITL